jgi:hypothetical protein
VGFIVANLETPSRAPVLFHNEWGMAEQWFKWSGWYQGRQAGGENDLSLQVRLALSL